MRFELWSIRMVSVSDATTLALPSEQDTARLANTLRLALPADFACWTVLLRGELGAGKSTLARAWLRSAGHDGSVPSPTYTLIEPYTLSSGTMYHIDLYRISSEEELHFLGWDDLDDGLKLIEWPERVPSLQKTADLLIELRYSGDDSRAALVSGLSSRGRLLVSELEFVE